MQMTWNFSDWTNTTEDLLSGKEASPTHVSCKKGKGLYGKWCCSALFLGKLGERLLLRACPLFFPYLNSSVEKLNLKLNSFSLLLKGCLLPARYSTHLASVSYMQTKPVSSSTCQPERSLGSSSGLTCWSTAYQNQSFVHFVKMQCDQKTQPGEGNEGTKHLGALPYKCT